MESPMSNGRKIDCKIRKRDYDGVRKSRVVHWKRCLPFISNPRAILIHRTKSARTYFWDGEPSHNSFGYWCGNGGHSSDPVAVPPAGRLLCARCEAAALKAGQPTADSLAGFHVHLGELRARKLCCLDDQN
jgi:hypothetical protein